MPNSKLESALDLTRLGFKVFPLHHPEKDGCSCKRLECKNIGKHPRITEWQTKASLDPIVLRAWWAQYPLANIGVPCGDTTNLFVIDIDAPAGMKLLEDHPIADTPTVLTSKGRHIYLKHPRKLLKSVVLDKNKYGFDIRTTGTLVAAAGSKHASGATYRWADGLSPDQVELKELPKWWVEFLSNEDWKKPAKAIVPVIAEGSRNSTLASWAGKYRSQGLGVDTIKACLADLNSKFSPPLGEAEVHAIAESYGRYDAGKVHPKATVMELMESIKENNRFISTPRDEHGRGVYIHIYQGGVFTRRGEAVAIQLAFEALQKTARPENVNSIIELLRMTTAMDEEMLNTAACDLINVQNGMLDWHTGKLLPHDPNYLSTFQLQLDYDPKAKSKVLEKFIADVVPEDTRLLVEEMIGYLLLPSTKYQKAFMLVGQGRNGKSTFLNMLSTFFGKDVVARVSLHDLNDDKFAASGLQGKLLNIFDDLPSTRMENTSAFKIITSGNAMMAQHKFGHPFVLKTTVRLIFSANEFPRSSNLDNAYFSRWLIIPFPNKFIDKTDDRQLGTKLQSIEVKQAILNMAIRGLQRLEKNEGFSLSQSTLEQEEKYKIESDSSYAFIKERLINTQDNFIQKIEIYAEYTKWCLGSGIKFPANQSKFNKSLVSLGYLEHQKGEQRTRCWAAKWASNPPPATY